MGISIANPPEARPERVSRLITRIEQGDIKIPKFQRKFVWSPQQILDLLDSLYRGYPVGSILLWRTSVKLKNERNIGGFALPETEEQYPTNYILDGQQRITTIYGVLKAPSSPENSDFNVSFDLIQRRFFHPLNGPVLTQLPLNVLFETVRFRQFQQALLTVENGDELVQESDRVSETFREYGIPIITVTEADTGHVSQIFERINSTGTKLTVFDLMVAATWSEDFDLNDHVNEIVAELDEKDFGDIDRVTILRALATCALDSAKRETVLNLRDLSRGELVSQMESTKEALRRAVDFLATEVSVVSDAFLPYERQLVLLAYIMSRNSRLGARQAERLQRWFWRTSFSERYRRGGEGLFDGDLETATHALADASELRTFGRGPESAQFIDTEFRKTSALPTRMLAFWPNAAPET